MLVMGPPSTFTSSLSTPAPGSTTRATAFTSMTAPSLQHFTGSMALNNDVSGTHHHCSLTIIFLTAAFESFLNGVFLILAFGALYLWFTRSHGLFNGANRAVSSPSRTMINATFKGKCAEFFRRLSNPLVYGSILLILTVNAHWICTIVRLLRAASLVESNHSPVWLYDDLSQPTFVLMSLIVTISIPIADSLLIWRLWIISRKSKLIIIPPILGVVAFLAGGFRVTVWFSGAQGPWHHFFHPDIKNWILCNAIVTALTNIYCSVCLTVHICRITMHTKGYLPTRRRPILNLIIESATLHSIWSTVIIIAYQTQSKLSLLVLQCGPAVAAIAFMLINVRAGLGWDARPESGVDGERYPVIPTWMSNEGAGSGGVARRRGETTDTNTDIQSLGGSTGTRSKFLQGNRDGTRTFDATPLSPSSQSSTPPPQTTLPTSATLPPSPMVFAKALPPPPLSSVRKDSAMTTV
ncbi:hypothetical protein CC2G_013562 [Coprinopsis cinerea AmutBmut pab1-1]|nr:hypothetical protein CC2G_013562 [Coprinopsis cinerea AmutBmut pab1-1]